MFMKYQPCSLFLDPQDEVGPSISSSVDLCSFVLLVYIITLVLIFYLCPSSVRVVATFSGAVLFPLLCSMLPFFPWYIDYFLYLVLLFQVSVSKIPSVLLLNICLTQNCMFKFCYMTSTSLFFSLQIFVLELYGETQGNVAINERWC